MKIKLYNQIPKKDYEGDWSFLFRILPNIEYSYSGSIWGNSHLIFIHWLFWEIQIKL